MFYFPIFNSNFYVQLNNFLSFFCLQQIVLFSFIFYFLLFTLWLFFYIYVVYLTYSYNIILGKQTFVSMRINQNQTFRVGELSPQIAKIIQRTPRKSEPMLLSNPTQNCNQNYKTKNMETIKKLPRSPQIKPLNHILSKNSGPISKNDRLQLSENPSRSESFQQYKLLNKCTSARNLNLDKKNSLLKNNFVRADRNKSFIQNNLKILDKIQSILFSNRNQKKEQPVQKNYQNQKVTKSLRCQQYIQDKQKKVENFQDQRDKNNKQDINTENNVNLRGNGQISSNSQHLKQSMSTQSTTSKIPKQLKISQFKLGRQIGRGRFGVVKLAIHLKTGFIFAIKIIKKSVILQYGIVQQLIQQIKIQFYLNHSNLTKIYSVFQDFNNCYLLMELCPQGNLYSYMKRVNKIGQDEAKLILKDICKGIVQMHANNLVHRDLKPENIVLSFGMAKICDFGWATLVNDQLRNTFCGTPLYLSPELVKGAQYDQKVDIWAVGAIFYQIIVGNPLFQIKNKQDLNKIVSEDIIIPQKLCQQTKQFLLFVLIRDQHKRKSIFQIINHSFLKSGK